MGCASLQSTIGIGNCTASVIVEMSLDIAADNTSQSSDQVVDLSWRCASNGICNTNTVYANLVDCRVNGEKVDQARSEGVLAGESDFNVVRLDVVDDLNCGVGDIGHVLAVGVLHQIGRSADNDVTEAILSKTNIGTEVENLHSINTSLNSNSGIVHVASDMGENLFKFSHCPKRQRRMTNLSLQSKLADGLAISS